MGGALANPFFDDLISIYVDFERRQGEYQDNFRISITISRTRRLHGFNTKQWRTSELQSFRFRIQAWSSS